LVKINFTDPVFIFDFAPFQTISCQSSHFPCLISFLSCNLWTYLFLLKLLNTQRNLWGFPSLCAAILLEERASFFLEFCCYWDFWDHFASLVCWVACLFRTLVRINFTDPVFFFDVAPFQINSCQSSHFLCLISFLSCNLYICIVFPFLLKLLNAQRSLWTFPFLWHTVTFYKC
jgi:hypothetical protein